LRITTNAAEKKCLVAKNRATIGAKLRPVGVILIQYTLKLAAFHTLTAMEQHP
jgi:hypothetical protein